MEGDEQILAARARLTLRAERAMGMTAAPIRRRAARAQSGATIEPVAPQRARPIERPIATPAPVPVRPVPPSIEKSTAATTLPVMPTLIPVEQLPPLEGPAMSREEKIAALAALDAQEVRGCTKCPLSATRTHTVFGEGNVDARVMFVGEGPGENEDLQGRPFVGRAGEQLNKQIAAMGLKREDVFIANVVKCRPPGNRTPAPHEVATCTPYLARQIEIIRPEAIITLGLPATQHFLQTNAPMKRLRGVWASWRGIAVMPTYHPAYLLRAYTQENRAAVWSDLKQVMQKLGLKGARGES
jgi:DNA polymerase